MQLPISCADRAINFKFASVYCPPHPTPRPAVANCSTDHVVSSRSIQSFLCNLPGMSKLHASQPHTTRNSGLAGWLPRHFRGMCWSSSSRDDASVGGPLSQEGRGDNPSISSSTTGQQPQQPQKQQQQQHPTHLIVMVNGLFGSAANWDVICEHLKEQLPPDTLLHASKVNSRFSTYQGIDACGQRLADEVRSVVATTAAATTAPRNSNSSSSSSTATGSLTRISIIAHSMGGLMARYAIGALYNPVSGTICGLTPCHFISMATPHCGCDADGVAQVPFIGWTGDLPLLGQQLYRFLSNISGSTASLIFQRTGEQFFLLDGSQTPAATSTPAAAAVVGVTADSSNGGGASSSTSSASSSTAHLPLLLQMSQDCPDRGLFFYSALAAFKTRTCYANMDGDHLVGFANSSLRNLHQLPPPPPTARTAKGVVLEDSLSAAFWPHTWQQLQQQQENTGRAAAMLSEAAAAAVQGALQQPYTASRDWSDLATRQRQQQQQLVASSAAADESWHELNGRRGSSSSSTQQQQQQQHPSSALAALELEAAGAAPAATALLAGEMLLLPGKDTTAAAVQGSSSPSTAAAADSSADDDGELMVELSYSSPVGGHSTTPAVSSMDDLTQQQQHQGEGVSAAPAAVSAAAAAGSSSGGGGGGGGGAAATAAAAVVVSAEADLTSGLSGDDNSSSGGGGQQQQQLPPVLLAESPAAAAAGVAADAAQMSAAAAAAGGGGGGGGGAGGAAGRAEVVSHMLRRLQALPWRRVDVSFQGAKFGFAHNNIQVTRRWWNFEGVAVPAHLAQQLQLMDTLIAAD